MLSPSRRQTRTMLQDSRYGDSIASREAISGDASRDFEIQGGTTDLQSPDHSIQLTHLSPFFFLLPSHRPHRFVPFPESARIIARHDAKSLLRPPPERARGLSEISAARFLGHLLPEAARSARYFARRFPSIDVFSPSLPPFVSQSRGGQTFALSALFISSEEHS